MKFSAPPASIPAPVLASAVLALLLCAPAEPAVASGTTPAARIADEPAAAGKRHRHRLTYPAHALSFGFAPFALHPRGVDWPGLNGNMSLTLRRPADYKGGPVRLTLFHQVMSDDAGEITFTVTPVTLNHGDSFETYGSVASDTVPAPMTLTILLEQSALIPPGNGFFPDGDWWYFEIRRQGSYAGPLRIMSVAIDY
ncbi:hypothetical protein [Marilutibacter chinensis]|uniref:DUF4402 domain-containing protein n=1 Tax=Marilutibacter chinensis TaxID=2912247 RepID=A0ABS9HTM1_9GAMM|nr:hypothetical protein [Lysobacter chinensis]MCF7222246.1 hypothetical protein [Lysobacter chinensis]